MTELPPGWAQAPLGGIAETRLGKMLSAKARGGPNPRPYLRNKNVQWGRFDLSDLLVMDFDDEEFERFRVVPGDLLVCEGGEVGRAAIWHGQIDDVGYQKALHRVRPAPGVAAEHLLYAFRWFADTHAFESFITGSTINHLPQEDLRRLPIPLPPEAEQRRIVAAIEQHFSRLDAADKSLAQARRRLDTLRAAILATATSNYEPVEFGDLVSDLRYGTSIKCSYDAAGPPVLRIPNVQSGSVDLSDLKFATDSEVDFSKFALERGDLLFVRTNGSRDLIGRVASVDGAEGMAFASYLIRARPDRSRLDPRFAVIALSTLASRTVIESKAATTAGQYNLNLAALRSLRVPLPSVEEQSSIVAEVDRQLSIIDAMSAQIDHALGRSAALRRSILEQAFSGKLVPQDPSDEPASALLERIAAEQAGTLSERRTVSSRRAETIGAK